MKKFFLNAKRITNVRFTHRCPGKENLAMVKINGEEKQLDGRNLLEYLKEAGFPKEMQVKLRGAKVAIAGLGGLGSNIAVMLARSGIGLMAQRVAVCAAHEANKAVQLIMEQ